MFPTLKPACLLLCAAPALALADPVVVTTRTSGSATALPVLLTALGMDPAFALQELPYSLTLSSTYDPNDMPSVRGDYDYDYDSAIVVDFRLGDMHYRANANGASAVLRAASSGNDTYEHQVEFLPPDSPWSYKFRQVGILALPSLDGAGALTPRTLGPTDVVFGTMDITAYTAMPDAPGPSVLLGSTVSSMSVQVVSAVPEPAPFALLAAGVLTLGLRRRFGRAAP